MSLQNPGHAPGGFIFKLYLDSKHQLTNSLPIQPAGFILPLVYFVDQESAVLIDPPTAKRRSNPDPAAPNAQNYEGLAKLLL
jgi:hypothetical protein